MAAPAVSFKIGGAQLLGFMRDYKIESRRCVISLPDEGAAVEIFEGTLHGSVTAFDGSRAPNHAIKARFARVFFQSAQCQTFLLAMAIRWRFLRKMKKAPYGACFQTIVFWQVSGAPGEIRTPDP